MRNVKLKGNCVIVLFFILFIVFFFLFIVFLFFYFIVFFLYYLFCICFFFIILLLTIDIQLFNIVDRFAHEYILNDLN